MSSHSLHILAADDEPLIRMGLKTMLGELGHRVTVAANGREALRMLRRQPFDLAILDIAMPFSDGLATAKAASRARPLPIIILTAYSERDLIEEASDLPIHGYLVKPVNSGQLAAAIAVARKRFAEAQAQQQKADTMARRLEERRLIERAKRRLMAGGADEEEAYRLIQQAARDTRRTMREVALVIVQSGDEVDFHRHE